MKYLLAIMLFSVTYFSFNEVEAKPRCNDDSVYDYKKRKCLLKNKTATYYMSERENCAAGYEKVMRRCFSKTLRKSSGCKKGLYKIGRLCTSKANYRYYEKMGRWPRQRKKGKRRYRSNRRRKNRHRISYNIRRAKERRSQNSYLRVKNSCKAFSKGKARNKCMYMGLNKHVDYVPRSCLRRPEKNYSECKKKELFRRYTKIGSYCDILSKTINSGERSASYDYCLSKKGDFANAKIFQDNFRVRKKEEIDFSDPYNKREYEFSDKDIGEPTADNYGEGVAPDLEPIEGEIEEATQ